MSQSSSIADRRTFSNLLGTSSRIFLLKESYQGAEICSFSVAREAAGGAEIENGNDLPR